MKRCFKCGDEKPIDEFYKHPGMKDGVLGKCKECAKQDANKNRAKNIEYYRWFDRQRANAPSRVEARAKYAETDAGKIAKARAGRDWYFRNAEKKQANRKLARALRKGLVEKQPCVACGETAQGHHYDYSRPLDVVWLCTKHHAEVHRMKREAERT